MPAIRKAAVLGSGVMGSAIAAHLANAGIPTLLLDMPAPESKEGEASRARNSIAEEGLKKALKASPAAFGHKDRASMVSVGNFEDDLDKLAGVDWVVEAVVERMDVKKSLFAKVAQHLGPNALLTTNTSGLSVCEMAEGLPIDLKSRFFGTHFFNPPRYMYLLELIPTPTTDPAVLKEFSIFAEDSLGKGVVAAKDTPNFIANRIGIFSVFYTMKAMEKHGLTPDVADALSGRALGRPKSATFRTADLVGLDILSHVAKTQYDGAPDDERRDVFLSPDWLSEMLEKGLLGQKSGAGFYKKAVVDGEKEIQTIDLSTLEYGPKTKAKFPILGDLKNVADPGMRIAKLVSAKGVAGEFAWDLISQCLLYAANRLPEISDDIAGIDRGMRWGFGWDLGPFETWDALGVKKTVERMLAEGMDVPKAVKALADSETPSFYSADGKGKTQWNLAAKVREVLPERRKVVILSDLKKSAKIFFSNHEATLLDIGDRVACLEFHSKMNSIGGGILGAIRKAVAEAGNGYDALVVGNQGENFSVGANLMQLLFEALEGNIYEIDAMIRAFQGATMALKYSPIPVVGAPFGRVLGGGAEVCLHCHGIQASHETYIGLVEFGVGLIPAGGGTKELLVRAMKANGEGIDADRLPFMRKVFETIGTAKVSMSAREAFDLGFFRSGDGVTMNRDHLIRDAKQAALSLLETGWQPLHGREKVKALGRDGFANVKMILLNMKEAGQISEHDALVAEKLGWILCGGEIDQGTEIDEDYLLDLERRAFVELIVQPKTIQRIQHILQTGKPLRN